MECRLWVKSGGDDRDDATADVRFAPKADKRAEVSLSPLSAKRRHNAVQQTALLFDQLVGEREQRRRRGHPDGTARDAADELIKEKIIGDGHRHAYAQLRAHLGGWDVVDG